jgi:hypothetical protein
MSTSGSYNFTSTRDEIITRALRRIGALGDTETLDSIRQAVGIEALNPMIKAWQAFGMPIWAITEQAIAMSNWTSSTPVTIGPDGDINQIIKPLKVLQAIRRDTSADEDTPLTIYTYEDYNNLSNKESESTPVHIFYQPQRLVGSIWLWPVPDDYWQTYGELVIRYQRPFQDFDASSDEPDFPVEWHEAIHLNLALRLAGNYGYAPNDYKVLLAQATSALELAKSFDQEEGSIRFQPAQRQ